MKGVIKKLSRSDRPYYEAADVQELLGVGKSTAYRLIRSVRTKSIKAGVLTAEYPIGKIPKKLFNSQFLIE